MNEQDGFVIKTRPASAQSSAKGATLTDVLSTHYGQNGCTLSFMSDGTIKLDRHGHVIITTASAIYSAMGNVKVDNVLINAPPLLAVAVE